MGQPEPSSEVKAKVPALEQINRQMALRYVAAIVVGLLAAGYVIAIAFDRIPKDARIDFPAIVIVLLAGVAIALLCTSRASEAFKDTLSRVRTFEISSLKIELNQIRTRQERQSSQLDLLQLLAPLVLSEHERRHLLNLRQGTTANYRGNHDLRSDLRRLRYLTLIITTQSVHSGAADGTVFDLKDLVQLTPLGANWAQQLQEMEQPRPEPLST
jgi:hypothetical protein